MFFNQQVKKENEEDKINILFWNSFWVYPLFAMGEGNTGFIKSKCRYTNCYTTHHRSALCLPDKKIDAVVVHGLDRELNKELRAGHNQGRKYMASKILLRTYMT